MKLENVRFGTPQFNGACSDGYEIPASPATSTVFENRFDVVLELLVTLTANVLFVLPFATVRLIGKVKLVPLVLLESCGITLNCSPVLSRYCRCALRLIVSPRPPRPGPPPPGAPPPRPPPPPPRPPGPAPRCGSVGVRFWLIRRLTLFDDFDRAAEHHEGKLAA